MAAVACAAVDTRPLVFDHLSTRQGLPQSTVMVTLQDSQGFVWLGTEDGLVRFDGRETRIYAAKRNDPESLPSNYIDAIVEDAQHDLWIAIKGGGLARWNRGTDRFTVFQHDPADPGSLAGNQVRALLRDRQGRIWVGLIGDGIDRFEIGRGGRPAFRHFQRDAGNDGSLADNNVHTLFMDRDGTVWIGLQSGLDRWQESSESFAHYPHYRIGSPAPARGQQGVTSISQDSTGALWVGNYESGLQHLDSTGHVIQSFLHDARQPDSLSDNDVRAVLEDRAGHLWVGTASGLDLLDRRTGRFSHYRHDPANVSGLLDSFIMSLYEDGSGLLWVGTRSGGVSRWSPRSWELGSHRPGWLENRLVTGFAEAADNALWVASMGGGLVKLDVNTGEWIDIDHVVGRPDALGDRRVMALQRARNGALWIGTMSGLRRLSPDGKITSIPTRAGDPRALSNTGVMHLYEAHDGKIWVGTHGGGANVVDPVTLEVRQLPVAPVAPGAVSGSVVSAFAEDGDGFMWIGTDGAGLNLARADGTVIAVYRHDKADSGSIASNTIYALSRDSQGRLWVATDGGGLDQVMGSGRHPESIRFANTSKANGLSGDTVYSALADNAGRLWLSGNNGLTRFDPATGEVKTYHREHGLQGDEFNYGAYFRTADGRLCFGGPGGFNVFDPARLTEDRNPPRITLTSMMVQGIEARGTPPWQLLNHTFEYDHNVVSLKFAALDFTSPERNRLEYRLDTLGNRWWDFSAERTVSLNNLEPGEHLLEVRAANVDSVWSKTPYRLRLYKKPPPWRSALAYSFYLVAGLFLIALGVAAQRRKLRLAVETQRQLEAEVALRTRELQHSNHQLAEASKAKSDFLARMGHELRTPMNGVVGMTELLTRTHLTESQSRLTSTIRASARTLLEILNDLLDLSKINAGKIQLESLPVNLTTLTDEVAALFAVSAEARKLELVVCPPGDQRWLVSADALRLRQVLMNLIGNAIKFTSQGEVVLRSHIDVGTGQRAAVRLTVTDSGIGMTPAAMARIFDPFTQADETTTRRFGGTGLGLAICRELVELMGGKIRVDSEPDAGSTFTVEVDLPIHGAAPVTQLDALKGRPVRILTRRRSLNEALHTHLQVAGLVIADAAQSGPVVQVVDADSCAAELQSLLAGGSDPAQALIVVASGAAIDRLGLEQTLPAQRIVRKPVTSEALGAALQSLVGPVSTARGGAVGAIQKLSGHVLIVDDEPVNAAVAEGYLAALGCTSVCVSDGFAAITRCAVEQFDAVLMDINMSDLDGYVTTQRIREREPAGQRVPIIALTANEAQPYRERCLQAGMDDILSKPYTIAECADVLRRWIPGAGVTEAAPAADVPARRAADSLAAIDPGALARLRVGPGRGRNSLHARLVELFQTTSADTVAGMRTALASSDLAACGALAHKLRASAANVGATAFSNAARELEVACRAGSAARAAELLARMLTAYPVLVEDLVQMCQQESA